MKGGTGLALAALGAGAAWLLSRNTARMAPGGGAIAPPASTPDQLTPQYLAALRDLGYAASTQLDGTSAAAIRTFQSDHGLTPNGQLDAPTMRELQAIWAETRPIGPAPASTSGPGRGWRRY